MREAEEGAAPGRGARGLLLNLVLAVASALVTVLLGLAVLAIYVRWRGGDVDREHMVSPRPSMWQRDEVVGYRNQSYFDRRAFGGIRGRTNAEGFRSDHEITPRPEPGRTRIFGIGDSVTWGVRVNREEAYLGFLEQRLLEQGRAVEIINGGVVGYSTLQEKLFLEQHAARYSPDVVLVNYCDNDWLPSEDPFSTVPRVYQPYLATLASERRGELGEAEAGILPSLRADLHRSFAKLVRDPESRRPLRRILIEIPMLDMARFARERGIRLVYLFIPARFHPSSDPETRAALQALLIEAGVEVIDLRPDLGEVPKTSPGTDQPPSRLQTMLTASRIGLVFDTVGLAPLAPARLLDRFGRLRTLDRIHAAETYVDDKGHPTRRGNSIIAERVAAALFP